MKSPEKDVKSQGKVSRKSYEKSNNEILKLKELPNERLEGSWVALRLGLRTCFGFKLGAVGLEGEGKLMKRQKNEILKAKELPMDQSSPERTRMHPIQHRPESAHMWTDGPKWTR